MNGKLVTGFIVIPALIVGAVVYYVQEYAYYRPVEAASDEAVIRITDLEGRAEPMLADKFEGIDADSSPLRFRGCFQTPMSLAMLSETYVIYPGPTPLNAPSWFTCFDSGRLTEDLATGKAVAFLSEKNISPGVDRVVAVYPDGRAFAWQQPNESAEK
ncbi:MAG TPA: DUF6446 family protein [Albidovulum sp.]|uniref:DUF6446 family protein n=1 Tax=Albidovulum sp. TaxID=1872424 RepID=UPI002D02620F|nr:DUF6446 family protein [Albidovulum sp.]